jgi:hypothetical protein
LSDEENESVEEAAVERNNVKIDVLNKAKLDMIDRRVWISRFNQQRLENDSGKNMVSNSVVNEGAIKDDDNVAIPISDGMKVVEELQQKMISKKNMAVAEEKNKEWSELKNIAVELNKNKKSTDTLQRKKKEIKTPTKTNKIIKKLKGKKIIEEVNDSENDDDKYVYEIKRDYKKKYFMSNSKRLIKTKSNLESIENHRKGKGYEGEVLVKYTDGIRDWCYISAAVIEMPNELDVYMSENNINLDMMESGKHKNILKNDEKTPAIIQKENNMILHCDDDEKKGTHDLNMVGKYLFW